MVLDKDPLPAHSGSRQRAIHLISAMRAVADVDLLLLGVEADLSRRKALRDELGICDVKATGGANKGTPRRLPGSSRSPSAVPPAAAELRRIVGVAMPSAYDLALHIGLGPWRVAHPALDAHRTIVDTENVMSRWARRMARLEFERARLSNGVRPRAGALRRAGQHLADASSWRALERAVGPQVQSLIVCSEPDLRALGVPNVVILPNGVDLPAGPLGGGVHASETTLVFPGKMTYAPNLDAAYYLARELLPELIRVVPSVRVMIAGRAPSALQEIASDHLEVTGYVDSMSEVLRRADAVIVPLRAGGGTRIKILEAWAHGLPVVSTTVGAEGLDASDGIDLLIADDPVDFAAACRRVLTDHQLRTELTTAGLARVAEHFDWQVIEQRASAWFARLLP